MKVTIKYLTFCLLLSLASLPSQSQPDDLQKQSIKLIKKLDKWDTKTYNKYILTVDAMHELAEGSLIENDFARAVFAKIDQEDWEKQINSSFEYVRDFGHEYGINWRKIKFVAFENQPVNESGINFTVGKFIFSYDEIKYSIEVRYVKTADGYRLAALREFSVM